MFLPIGFCQMKVKGNFTVSKPSMCSKVNGYKEQDTQQHLYNNTSLSQLTFVNRFFFSRQDGNNRNRFPRNPVEEKFQMPLMVLWLSLLKTDILRNDSFICYYLVSFPLLKYMVFIQINIRTNSLLNFETKIRLLYNFV